MTRALAIMMSVALLSACNPLSVFRPSQEHVLQSGWYPAEPLSLLKVRYCYRTLAEVDCHAHLLPAENGRRVGWFDAPVED